ncbi:hypothetical protein [Amycolatopsis sp. cmx-11-32]|uniref:hypothetical protein n=1 Tax=Amycolatopsis sp. cmx-11-32 TaxID=2785796 RepID=UPI0039E57949
MTAMVTRSGVRLAPAHAGAGPDGPVRRIGIWPADAPAPIVLSEDELALALAHGDDYVSRFGTLPDDAARRVLRGVHALGRGQLCRMVERWHVGNETDVFPPGFQSRCTRDAAELCRKVHLEPR